VNACMCVHVWWRARLTSLGTHRTTIDTNYYGTRHVCSRFMPLLRDNGTFVSSRTPHTHIQAVQQLTWGFACAAGRVVNVTARMASLSKLTVPTLKAAFAKPDLTLVRCLALDDFICEPGSLTRPTHHRRNSMG
jgi:NAD(P)-dependent dehydrogenase (short-subunit alcohol dehydrogenase family)